MDLSTHFTLEELVHSQTADRQDIDNTPTAEIVENLRILARGLEAVRALLGRPMIISSGYRCPRLNQVVGGATNSDHMRGLAADFICPQLGTPAELAQRIRASDIVYDQLIYEYTWCHIGFAPALRRQALTLNKQTRGYLPGIVVV
jgi:hypothetical protein